MPAASPILAKSYDFIQDPKGWMLSEKLDGIRAIWDGKQFVSREGNIIPAPAWFTADLPVCPLDGELWIGRGKFQATLSEVNSGRFDKVKFMVFDAPAIAGGFSWRLSAVTGLIADCKHARPVLHLAVKSREHCNEFFHALVAAGGEGIILRNPDSKYSSGRSSGFLKIKATADDEGVMIDHDGKAMRLDWSGSIIRLPMPANLRKSPPTIGAKITFKFNGLTDSGVPRHATFLAVRDYE